MIPNANRSILYTVAVLGILGLGFWASPAAHSFALAAATRLRIGQSALTPALSRREMGCRPIFSRRGGKFPSDRYQTNETQENETSYWTGEDYEQEGTAFGFRPGYLSNLAYQSVHDRFWLRGEFLAWWTKGFATPPLLTTSPSGTPLTQAGVLEAAGTSVLFGGEDLGGGFRPGERITFGTWLNRSQTLGVEASYLQLNRRTDYFSASGVTTPILARPFFNSETGQQDSQLVNYPGQQSGTFSAAAASELQVAEFLVRKNLNYQPGFGFDLVGGYRYQQLEDHLAVDDALAFSGTQSGFPAGSTVQQSDRFDTRNVFQGGVFGMSTSFHQQRWTFDTLLKVAVGQTHSRVAISGATATSIPGQTATLLPGGFLALPSNMGVYDSNQFSVVPELGLTLGFDFSSHLRATIGYDFLYWNNVARPGDQIDLNIDARQFPPPAISNAVRPQFTLHTSDYWAQGLNLGLDYRF